MSVIKGWIARDKDGSLFVYLEKPFKSDRTASWACCNCDWLELPKEDFPGLKWEHDPVEVEIEIKMTETW